MTPWMARLSCKVSAPPPATAKAAAATTKAAATHGLATTAPRAGHLVTRAIRGHAVAAMAGGSHRVSATI